MSTYDKKVKQKNLRVLPKPARVDVAVDWPTTNRVRLGRRERHPSDEYWSIHAGPSSGRRTPTATG